MSTAMNATLKPLSKKSALAEREPILAATEENIAYAKQFALQKWIERARERGLEEPTDLSYGCKFASLFVWSVFGGKLSGNYDHQFVVLDKKIIDLSHDSSDVRSLEQPHRHDPVFFGSPDHLDSMNSCLPRVSQWSQEFLEVNAPATKRRMAL